MTTICFFTLFVTIVKSIHLISRHLSDRYMNNVKIEMCLKGYLICLRANCLENTFFFHNSLSSPIQSSSYIDIRSVGITRRKRIETDFIFI